MTWPEMVVQLGKFVLIELGAFLGLFLFIALAIFLKRD